MKNIFCFLFSTIIFVSCTSNKEMKVIVRNHSSFDRSKELVEIPVEKITEKIKLDNEQVFVVKNAKREIIPSQVTFDGKLIFQSGINNSYSEYFITAGDIKEFENITFGRFIVERKDDFAWENDRVAFRIYGPALIAIDGPSNGIDIWYKRTNELIIDKWYKNDIEGIASYHEDHGEGMDDYKVGRSLGAGGMAPFVNDSLWLNENFVNQEILENGPLRTTVKFDYKNMDVDGGLFTETRTISIDAGSQLSKIIQEYGTSNPIKVAAGIPLREDSPQIVFSLENGYVIYTEHNKKGGDIFVSMVFPQGINSIEKNSYTYYNPIKQNKPEIHTHILGITIYQPNTPITYYTGYGWSKFGFETLADFQEYIENFCERFKQPLIVEY